MYIKIFNSNDISLTLYKKIFKVSHDINFSVNSIGYTVPEGMETDLGSIPIPFRNVFSRFGENTLAYIIHDFGYRVQPKNTDRKFWDDVLFELMKKEKSFRIKRFFIYRSLRLFGYKAWNKNKEKLKGDLFE